MIEPNFQLEVEFFMIKMTMLESHYQNARGMQMIKGMSKWLLIPDGSQELAIYCWNLRPPSAQKSTIGDTAAVKFLSAKAN